MKPTIDVGSAIQKSRLPGWLRWFFGLFRGTVIHTGGPVDVQLSEGQGGATPPRTGLDGTPHKPGPVTLGGPRR